MILDFAGYGTSYAAALVTSSSSSALPLQRSVTASVAASCPPFAASASVATSESDSDEDEGILLCDYSAPVRVLSDEDYEPDSSDDEALKERYKNY